MTKLEKLIVSAMIAFLVIIAIIGFLILLILKPLWALTLGLICLFVLLTYTLYNE